MKRPNLLALTLLQPVLGWSPGVPLGSRSTLFRAMEEQHGWDPCKQSSNLHLEKCRKWK